MLSATIGIILLVVGKKDLRDAQAGGFFPAAVESHRPEADNPVDPVDPVQILFGCGYAVLWHPWSIPQIPLEFSPHNPYIAPHG